MPVQQAAPPPVPVAALVPEAPKVFVPPVPPVQVEASSPTNTPEAVAVQPAAIGKAQQPTSGTTTGKSVSTGAKLGISFAAVAVLAGVGYGMFGGKGADVPRPERQAAAPVPAPAPSVAPAPVAPVPSPNAVDEKDDKIRQLESKLAAAEAEKQRALQAAEQHKSAERQMTSTPVARAAAPVVAPAPIPAAAPAPVPAVAPQQQLAPVPKNAKHLLGEFYLFKDSVKDLGNGFRGVYAYRNTDVAVGNQYHGQVQSQVARYVLNCQAAQFGMDQLYYFSQPHAQGQRVAWQEWQPNQVVMNPIQTAPEPDRKVYDFACRK